MAAAGARLELPLDQRPHLNEARLLLGRGELETVRTRSALLPRLDWFITRGKNGNADSFGRATRELDDASYRALVGLRLEQPMGNRAPRADHRRALVDPDTAETGLNHMIRLARHEVRRAQLDLERASARTEASAAIRAWREEPVRVETARFQAGQGHGLRPGAGPTGSPAEPDNGGGGVGWRQSLVGPVPARWHAAGAPWHCHCGDRGPALWAL